jgi:deoxyribose-phosphate aldolase
VATGFPSGQMPLKTRLEEIKYAVEKGATEIDIVIDRSLVLTGKWEVLYQEIQQMKEACGTAHMKAILATGELGTLNNVSFNIFFWRTLLNAQFFSFICVHKICSF